MSLSKEYAEMVQEQNQRFRFIHPLISGTEFSTYGRPKSRWMNELSFLEQKARQSGWQNIPPLMDPLHDPDTAIIITSPEEKIEWVNKGFFRMTGYTLEEVSGHTPSMLQGSETRSEDIRFMRNSIEELHPFSSVILNYRKNGDPYYCQVNIFPLFNRQGSLVNFLAIEHETSIPTG